MASKVYSRTLTVRLFHLSPFCYLEFERIFPALQVQGGQKHLSSTIIFVKFREDLAVLNIGSLFAPMNCMRLFPPCMIPSLNDIDSFILSLMVIFYRI